VAGGYESRRPAKAVLVCRHQAFAGQTKTAQRIGNMLSPGQGWVPLGADFGAKLIFL